MTTKRAGGEVLAETLSRLGVTEIFALHGSHLDPLFLACADHGIRLTDTRHEAARRPRRGRLRTIVERPARGLRYDRGPRFPQTL